MGNCNFCKIVDGNHRDITGIYHFPQIISMGNTVVRMYMNTVVESESRVPMHPYDVFF